MTFVSYAQNFEDVMLWRALCNVKHGFYVDVGAQDPVKDSVTKAFYERGWRGINLEPVQHYYELLIQHRPEDVNLQIAAGNKAGVQRFFEIPDTGLSTFSSKIAQRHVTQGWRIIECNVKVMPLSEILREHVKGAIHFLKIDAEGAEATVLRGLDLKAYRPWIIVVEATRPSLQKPAFKGWEPLLVDSNYHFVYFDGINRFYVADEHQSLSKKFIAPPNVFDEFVLYAQARIQQQLAELRKTQASSDSERGRLNEQLTELQQISVASDTEREQLRGTVQSLEAELKQESARLNETVAERDSLGQQIQELKCTLAVADSERGRLNEQLTELQQISVASDTEREQLRGTVQSLEAELQQGKEQERQQLEAVLQGKEQERQQMHEQLRAVLNSRSWRITMPLRLVRSAITWSVRSPIRLLQAVKLRLKALIKAILRKFIAYMNARPAFKAWCIRQVKRFPSLDQRLRIGLRQGLLTAESSRRPLVDLVVTEPQHLVDLVVTEPQHSETGLSHFGYEGLIASVRKNLYPNGPRVVSSAEILREIRRVAGSSPQHRDR